MNQKVTFLITGLLVLFITAQSQTWFGPQQIIVSNYASAVEAQSVYASDIDGDGDMDMLSASSGDNKIAWYENTDGNGTFGPRQVIIDSASAAYSVYTSDMDGDGDMDVLSASYYDDKIAWYENTDGNGTFGPQQIITDSAIGAICVYVTDIDGDGDMDVLSASFSDHKIAWYENMDGNGIFGPEKVITTDAQYATSVYVTDIDGDGDMDVLSASRGDNKIAWYENTDGNGAFGPQQVITDSAILAYCVYASDIDGDGDMDVLSASLDDDKIAWYENTDGSGTFGPQQVIIDSADVATSVYATDMDGDGDIDVLSASSNDDKIAWYENTDGNGIFGPQQVITDSATCATCVFATDVDGDGDMDVLSASFCDNKIAWYENTDGNGTFGPQQTLTTPSYAQGVRSVYSSDLDGDGDMDVLSASRADDKIAWYENTDGNGTFGLQKVISYVEGPSSVYATDIDGDGDMDVLSANEPYIIADPEISWHENTDGNGTFAPPQVISYYELGLQSVYATDIDGDGDMDILSYNFGWFYSEIFWHENTDGNGTFGPMQVIDINEATWSIYTSDMDGDGDMDVLSASGIQEDAKIAWYENIDGNGVFGSPQVIVSDTGARSVYASDIDGDGDMDVLSAFSRIGNSKICWSENTDGNGTFGTPQLITTSVDFPQSVIASDLDGDGDMDVLSASKDDDKIAWYENTDGNGTFGPQQIINTSADGANTVLAVDFDGDGDMDVLSASKNDDKIAWYENMTIDGIVTFQQNNILIYPNPSGGKFTLDFAGKNISRMKILDISGKIVWEKTEVQQDETIDLSGFSSGIYILSIQTDKELFTAKLVKQ